MSSQRVEPTTSITVNDFGVPKVDSTGGPKAGLYTAAQTDLVPRWGPGDWGKRASEIVEQEAAEDRAGGGN